MGQTLRGSLVAMALLGATAGAGAEPRATLAIIDAGNAALARKLQAESVYAGFNTVGVIADGWPEKQAEEPVAVIHVGSARWVELRIAALDGPVNTIEIVRARGEGDSFALRVIEKLRASLVDLGWELPAERSPPGNAEPAAVTDGELGPSVDAAPTSAARPHASERSLAAGSGATEPTLVVARDSSSGESADAHAFPRSLLSLDAGMAASWAAGGAGVTPHVLLGLRGGFATRWAASATALLPLAGKDVVAPEGEAHLSWRLFAGALSYGLPVQAPWFASAGLGAGLSVIDVRGEARPEFEGRRDRLLTGSYFVELGAGGRLASWLALRATLLTGLNAPRPVLEFDAREVASLGRFFGVLGLSADIGLIWAPIEQP